MNFINLFGALLLGSATSIACSQQAVPAHIPAANSSTKSGLNPSAVHTDGKCHFRIKNMKNQRYVDRGYTFYGDKNNPVGWGFGFGCNAGASQDDVYNQIGAKPTDGKWIDLDIKKPFKPKQHFKLIKFSGKNWKGIATAVDQIYYAPPDRRSRFFNFCLIENDGPQVLCGRTQIRGVTQPNSASKLPKIMAVLKTIVFVDPSTQNVPTPPAPSK